MPIIDLFSKRQKRLRGELPDVYQYTEIPKPLRGQVIHVFRDIFGDADSYQSQTTEAYALAHQTLCREYGRFSLTERSRGEGAAVEIFEFLLTATTEEFLDALEVGLAAVATLSRRGSFEFRSKPKMTLAAGIQELNARLREHGVGFQIEGGQVVRVDSQLLHQEAVRPALSLLTDGRFKTANEEFLAAHAHFREGRHKECLVECLKTLESVLKIICASRKWAYSPNDTASKLLDLVFSNGLLPAALQSEFSALRASLESGVPTVRNRLAGHGQGTTKVEVPEYVASYLLHLTAASVLLLVRAHDA